MNSVKSNFIKSAYLRNYQWQKKTFQIVFTVLIITNALATGDTMHLIVIILNATQIMIAYT